VYKAQTYSVDPSTGSVSTNALTTQRWYDHRGDVIKTSNPGEPGASATGVVQKSAYDGAGRETISYVSDGGGDTTWTDATNVTGDNVLSQAEFTYDKDGNAILVTDRERNHDETATGALGNPTTAPKARVSYSASYFDLANRLTATVDVGTNGGTAYTRPGTVPAASDTVLVTQDAYNAAGWVNSITDPRGIVLQKSYDNLGELTQTIEAYTNGTPTNTTNKITNFTYDGDGHRLTLQAVEVGGTSQTSKWIYGVTTAGGSDVNSNSILATVQYPDPSTGSPSSTYQESYTVNALGENKTFTDRAGNVHTLTYDILGRVTSDAITTLVTGFDAAVRRIQTAYDTQGNPYLVTSYDAPTAGNIVNQVQRAYNGLGQMTQEWQSHSGAVVIGTTPSVQYGYSLMAGGANHSRLTSITYPNGKVLTYNYGTAGGLNDVISRLASLSDTTGTLESYDYLGRNTVVRRAHSQPGVDLTYIKQTGEANGDAGDQYTGLDRFGRVIDQRWIVTSNGTHTDRFQYGYDRDSNALYRNNLVNTAFGELYHASGAGNGYDNLNQLSGFLRGVLTASGGSGTPLDTIASPSHTQTYTPDAVGNFSSITTDGTAVNRTHNQQNEVTGVGTATLAFDKNGNMTTDEQGRTLVYDGWNRLVAVKNGSTTLASYKFDGPGRRIQETAGSNTRDLFFDNWNVLEERLNGVSTADVQYVWNPLATNLLVLRDRSTLHNGTLDERLWIQQDANGNVTELVNSSGSAVERYVYDPYGKVTFLNASWGTIASSAYAHVYLFQGERSDPATGMYHMDRRDYSATLARFVSVDPSGFSAGDNNFYRFVANDPITRLDPTGLAHATHLGNGTLIRTGNGFRFIPDPPPGGSSEINWWFTSPWQTATDIWNAGGDDPASRVISKQIREQVQYQREYGAAVWPEGMSEIDKRHQLYMEMSQQKLPYHYEYGQSGMTMADYYAYKRQVEFWGPNGQFWDLISAFATAYAGYARMTDTCFPKGTLVGTKNGPKPIENLRPTDEVWSYDFRKGEWATGQVIRLREHTYDKDMIAILSEEDEVHSTGNHPFWVVEGQGLSDRPKPEHVEINEPGNIKMEGRWVDARDLRVRDVLSLRSGKFSQVIGLSRRTDRLCVYNIEVEGFHNYVVGNSEILVHNRGAGEAPSAIYREGRPSPSNLKPSGGGVSFRDSLSNPIDPAVPGPLGGGRPVFRPGEPYFGVDPSKLPPGSVIPDGVPGSTTTPPGHVSVVGVPPEVIKGGVIPGASGKFPK
jgi:RHS repeat-associated protein